MEQIVQALVRQYRWKENDKKIVQVNIMTREYKLVNEGPAPQPPPRLDLW